MRYAGGRSDERARSLKVPSHADPVLLELALGLYRRLFTRRAALHTIGVTLSNFVPAGGEQGCLFAEREAGRRAALYQAFDGVRSAFGHGALVSGRALRLKGRLDEDRHGVLVAGVCQSRHDLLRRDRDAEGGQQRGQPLGRGRHGGRQHGPPPTSNAS